MGGEGGGAEGTLYQVLVVDLFQVSRTTQRRGNLKTRLYILPMSCERTRLRRLPRCFLLGRTPAHPPGMKIRSKRGIRAPRSRSGSARWWQLGVIYRTAGSECLVWGFGEVKKTSIWVWVKTKPLIGRRSTCLPIVTSS